MAKRIVSADTIADEIYTRFGSFGLREKWHNYVHSVTDESKADTVTEYIINCEPELAEWLEELIPYIPYISVIDEVIKEYFSDDFYREDVAG